MKIRTELYPRNGQILATCAWGNGRKTVLDIHAISIESWDDMFRDISLLLNNYQTIQVGLVTVIREVPDWRPSYLVFGKY